MMTAEELGRLSVKHASWLSEGVRSWFTPKQPEMPMTKDLKSQAPSYNKSNETPFWQQKGLNKGNEKFYGQPYTGQSAKTETATQPQYNYFNPPTGHFKTELTPYSYFKPLYDQYPGGYTQAIADSQRWQDEAGLAGLPTWKPEDLHKPVIARGGNYVGPWEQRQGLVQSGGFTSKDPSRYGAYQTTAYPGLLDGNKSLSSEPPEAVMVNPEYASNPASDNWTRSMFGHELTHAMHSGNKHAENIFNKYKNQFSPRQTQSGGAGVGSSNDQRSTTDYMGTPTEFGAYLSELRRDWIEKNPGKRLSKPSEAESLLNYYNPENPDYGMQYFLVPEATAAGTGYDRQFPTDRVNIDSSTKDFYKRNPDLVERYREELKNLPKGYIEEPIYVRPPSVPIPKFQKLLPTIMSNPELKRKAILQILSSVVKNKQQGPAMIL